MKSLHFGLAMFLLAPTAVAAPEKAPGKTDAGWYAGFMLGRSELILGSEDLRRGFGIGLGYGKPEPRLRFRDVPAQLVLMAYYQSTKGDRAEKYADAYGVLATARYRFRTNGKVGAYLDLGWGLQATNRTSIDLDSLLNSTPMVGFGAAVRNGSSEILLGVGLLHISNAGLKGDNQGQNQLFLHLGFRF